MAKKNWTKEYLGGIAIPIPGPWESRTIDYGLLPIFETERNRMVREKVQGREYFRPRHGRVLLSTDMGRFTTEICGVLVPKFNVSDLIPSKLVMTENTKTNLRHMAKLIVDEKPLLLQSAPGAGKSFLIDETAKLYGRYEGTCLTNTTNADIVRITLTDQTDAKILL